MTISYFIFYFQGLIQPVSFVIIIMSEDNKIQIRKQERWIPQTSVYANEQMSLPKNLPCDSWRKPCCYAALYTQQHNTSMHTITASFNCLTLRSIETQSCRGSGWYLSRPELVLLSVRLIRQSFIFCPYNRHVISVCWLHYISAWFAWKAPLCFLAVGVVLLLRSSALLYSSWPGKITLRVL